MTGPSPIPEIAAGSPDPLVKALSLSPTVITVTALSDGRLVLVNDNFVRVTGYSREEALGRTPVELGLWVDPSLHREGLDRIRSRRTVENVEIPFRVKSGEIRTGLGSADLVMRDGQPCVLSVISDITDRKRAEEELERSKWLFQQILEATPDIVYMFDLLDWKIVYTNGGGERLLGYPAAHLEALALDGLRDLVHPEDADRVMAEIASRANLLANEIGETEFRLRHANGSWRWFRRRDAAFVRGDDGTVTRFVGIARDITAERDRGDFVRESEERLRLATEAAGVGTYDVDLISGQARWTPRVLEIYGLPPDAAPSRVELRALVHPDDQDRTQIEFDRANDSSGEFENEHRIVRPSGEVRWVIVRGRAIFEERGGTRRAVRALGAVVDITDAKRTEESLRTSEALFRSLANTAPTMIWTWAADGTATFQNSQWLRYTGLTEDENVTDRRRRVLHPEDFDRCMDEWARCLALGSDYEVEGRYRRHDGEYRWFLTRATPVHDGAGRITGWFGSSTDIHDKKLSEEARERLLLELEALDRRKDQFLAMLSHELRNPLAPIKNAVQLLRIEPPDSPSSGWAREVIDRQVEHLSHLIDDLLDLSRIASGKVRLDRQVIEFSTIISDALEVSRPLIEARRHQLTVAYPTEPVWLEGDLVRLTQVITNLLNNAAKFTEEGGRIRLTAAHADGALTLSIRDSGVGIAPELLSQVFDLFTQADGSLERAQGGLGVGLSLVRSLVGLHGGTVHASSGGVGQGSEFVVKLPTIGGPDRSRGSGPHPGLAGQKVARILVVDDNRDLADSTALLLQLAGHEVAVAFDGPGAIEQTREFRPAVVLLDVGLPGQDGYQVARTLRGLPEGAPSVLIAVTGYGMAEDRARSKEAGFDHHLVKPIDFTVLERLVHQSLT